MFNKLSFENIIKNKIATGVEIILLPDGAYEINVLSLKRNKISVEFENKHIGVAEIAMLSKIIDTKNPLVLVVNGKGIIHKKVNSSESDSLTSLLNKVLPNANLNEFYIQKNDLNSSQTYISVVRSTVIDDILNELEQNAISNIASCLIGPFVLNNTLSLIDKAIISNECLNLGNYKLLIREDQIHEVLPSDNAPANVLKVNNELLDVKLLVPFSAALSCFVGENEGVVNSDKIDALKAEFKQKQKFQFMGWALLIATFTILIVNYIVFNHYWEKSNEMNSVLVLNQSALKKYESLKAEYYQKKTFLEQNGLLETSRTSYFSDQIAASIPLSIQLLEMDIHPLKKKDVTDLTDAFYFNSKIIKISGKCNRNTELNDWMKELKKNNWIENVSLLNYKQDNAKDDGAFFLEVKLK